MTTLALEAEAARRFQAFLASLPSASATRIHVLCDSDCDGLPAGALLVRALGLAGYPHVTIEPKRKGESAWSPEVIERLKARNPEALFVLDLGSRADALLPGVPTLLIDHHLPGGTPPGSELITGYGTEPTPTTGLLVYWCLRVLIAEEQRKALLWLAALSILSDLGDKAPFAELAEARTLWPTGPMRDAVSLLNAPRRTANADATEALQTLLIAVNPKQISKGELPQSTALLAAKEEVAVALAAAKKAAPKFSRKYRETLGADLVALRMDTPCQVHPLVAQTWRGRFRDSIVMGVNFGFRPGYVHFSARGPKGVNVIQFLRAHAPAGADQGYGNGHDQASGGAVPVASWNAFAEDLGFGPELQLASPDPAA
ncbi:DHH family phosphoesterase [Acidipila sp. EB88]|uniref:DHH family phosphoesterase n=1 Tax=Acidipila sp. EB88 TaxID=2305226 RepID=UPI000F5DF104|nr:DHH family phosphoesterase [Acidipila sp. EB88]RRA48035.1 DHH family phosphoesterase [Acidipila sp. EB88]